MSKFSQEYISVILAYARSQFNKLTDTSDFSIRYLARRKQSPHHKQMMLDKAQAKRDKRRARNLKIMENNNGKS